MLILSVLATTILFQSANFQQQSNEPAKIIDTSLRQGTQGGQQTITIGSCKVVINRFCPDPDVTFYLYTKSHPEIPEAVRIGSDSNVSNLSATAFNPTHPTKVVIHGYNSDMFLTVLTEIRKEYIRSTNYNVFAVDWSPLAMGPCYPAAVWNSKHAGKCAAQLIERLREFNVNQLHVIGFSLGAHVSNFIARNLPAPYKIPRITGLDPAMPGFFTVGLENKLDSTDADFVDVVHTNAFIQGQVLESGHVDFYLNGGVVQPGCWAENRFFACNHHRAPLYFAESINTNVGFWGWPCASYVNYLLGRCPPVEPQIVMGEKINRNARGVYLVITDSVAPFAVGKFSGPAIEVLLKSEQYRMDILTKYKHSLMNYVDEDNLIDQMYPSETLINDVFVDDVFKSSNNADNYTDPLDILL